MSRDFDGNQRMTTPGDPRRATRRPTSRSGPRPPAAALPKWGWLEWFLIAQTFIPALLFLPGIAAVRTPIRVGSFGIGLAAWGAIAWSGRFRPGAQSYKPTFWLRIASVWLLLSIFHPNTNSLWAGFAHAILYISILSPAFWTHSTVATSKQITRLMVILFLCNGLSAMVGLGQVFRPGTFNPPVIPALADPNSLSSLALTYSDAAGKKISRPCGLTDQVGAASGAGATAALVGLALALRPIGFLKRACCLAVAFFGVAVIYYSQVRMILLMLVICLAVLVVVFTVQRNVAQAALLGGLSVGLIVVAFSWVAATSGSVVTDRFLTLLADDPLKTYQTARGGYVRQAFEEMMWDYPLGAGLGWWGQIYQFFADKTVPTVFWVEVMWPAWIVDGGIPLLFTYVLAITLAMLDSLRIALTTKDRELGFWAAVTLASNLSVLATCFSYVSFVSSIGMQFWFLSAALHAADLRSKAAARAAARPRPRRPAAALPGPSGPPPEHAGPPPGQPGAPPFQPSPA